MLSRRTSVPQATEEWVLAKASVGENNGTEVDTPTYEEFRIHNLVRVRLNPRCRVT